jgi:hypothetical protein
VTSLAGQVVDADRRLLLFTFLAPVEEGDGTGPRSTASRSRWQAAVAWPAPYAVALIPFVAVVSAGAPPL